jgi:hypothetical protein
MVLGHLVKHYSRCFSKDIFSDEILVKQITLHNGDKHIQSAERINIKRLTLKEEAVLPADCLQTGSTALILSVSPAASLSCKAWTSQLLWAHEPIS